MFRLLRVELFKIFSKPRSYIGFLAIAAIVMLLEIALYIDGKSYISFILQSLEQSFAVQGNLLNGYLVCFIILQTLIVQMPLLVALVTGDLINLNETLSKINRFDFHHLIPAQLFPETNLNVCINICLLNKKDNIQLGNQRPSQYFQNLLTKHGERAMEILESNYIDKDCLNALLGDNIQQFFNYRKEIFKHDIEKMTGRRTIPNTGLQVNVEEDEDDN